MSVPAGGDPFDVVVVGAGPAGSACATHLLQASDTLRVALLDKAQFPRDKACGDGLGPGVVRQLKALGVPISSIPNAQIIDSAEVHGKRDLMFRTNLADLDGSGSYGLTARRVDFDDLLRQRALSCGATYFGQTRFVSWKKSGTFGEVGIQCPLTGEESTISTRLLVGADGASSRVRKSVGIAPNPASRTGIALRAYADIDASHADRIYISFEDKLLPGYGWCFPFSDGTANVGVGMVIKNFRQRRPKLDALLDDFLENLRRRGLDLGSPSDYSTHILPHGGELPRLTASGAALVGDSGSMINPLSGEGIVYGLRAAHLLSEAVVPPLLSGQPLDGALDDYERQVRRQFSRHLRSNYIAHRLLRNRAWSRFVLGAASRDTHLQALAIDLMFGDGHITLRGVRRIITSGVLGLVRT